MNKQFDKRIKIIALSLLLLIVVSISFSFAYIRGGAKNNESISTVALKGGNINIRYENNSGEIIANDIVPGFEVTKKFTITSEFGNRNYYTSGVWYTVALIIDKNDFDDNSIQYSISLDKSSSSEGLVLPNRENIGIPNGSTSNRVIIGSGRIYSNNLSHTYKLKISYPYRRGNQSHEIGCEFHAHIDIINTDFVKLAFNLDGGRFNNLNLYNNSVEVAANSTINLPIPNKDGYIFAGWEILSENVSTNDNVITTNDSDISLKALWNDNVPYEFAYTGGEQEFIVELPAYYKLEAWGAQGGAAIPYDSYISSYPSYQGGYGGYSVGVYYLNKSDILYINVGGEGSTMRGSSSVTIGGGYNGGGSASGGDGEGTISESNGSGGGATHIAISTGLLSSFSSNADGVVIVSGGGGGAKYYNNSNKYVSIANGGHGGGFSGGNSTNLYRKFNGTVQDVSEQYSLGGLQEMQTISSYNGLFGKGADYSAGGGGGYYGGATIGGYAAGGGSGYIGNALLTDKYMYCYNCPTSDVESTKTYTTTCAEETPTADCAKIGNGYARITYLHN